MRATLRAAAAALVSSSTLRQAQRLCAAGQRRSLGRRPRVLYFHDWADPFSALAASALPAIVQCYDIDLQCFCVGPGSADAVPDPERWGAWSERDAARLSLKLSIAPASNPAAFGVPVDTPAARGAGEALRARLGHYGSAMFYFEGEWYWGLDRLSFLEERLKPFRRAAAPPGEIAPRPPIARSSSIPSNVAVAQNPENATPLLSQEQGALLEVFASLRSPYSYLALEQLAPIVQEFGATVRLRMVLPMVMRGLPVSSSKRLYIVRDCKREAERLGLAFGRICDPLGAPAERGLALIHYAARSGRELAVARSFLRAVFAEGIDAGGAAGLRWIAGRAGLNAEDVRAALEDDSWREEAERNRMALFAAGLWGVPSFRAIGPGLSGEAHWGQDRLWAVADDWIAARKRETTA